jgi:membrane protein DedA with SNARE-associated domain
MLPLASLFLATFVSEDLACVTAGVLIQRGAIDPVSGVAACALGIAAGDVALWAAGRIFGVAALRSRWVAPQLRGGRFEELSGWLSRHAGAAIFGSRFLPGTRLPTYVMSGFMGVRLSTFAAWTIAAAAVWTPIPVFFSAGLGSLFSLVAAAPLLGVGR